MKNKPNSPVEISIKNVLKSIEERAILKEETTRTKAAPSTSGQPFKYPLRKPSVFGRSSIV